ncbi:MAG: zinc ribbon domain-containing protein [Halobacteriales archaeon]|nr:zinc ribbon domain-containing protein [Halobacteriales archaeon]
MSEQRPAPESYLDDGALTAAAWTRALRDGVLLGQRCPACGHVTGAPKAACAHCGERDLAVEALPTAGEVYTETTIAVAPEGFEAPYRVGVVELGDGRVLGRIPEDAAIGDEVTLAGAREADDRVAPVFE